MSAFPRLVFAGTPDFAAQPLHALLQAGIPVHAVYTQPDRPAGRGRKLSPSAVKQIAEQHGIPVYQPKSLREEAAQQELQGLQPDIFLVIAYGLILPQTVLDIPKLGCINLHASLLPRWRGAAPIQRAIEAGDRTTGLCLMQMEAGLDTGPVLASAELPIETNMSGGSLHDALIALGKQRLTTWMQQYAAGELLAQIQDETLATYAHKLNKSEAALDWQQSSQILANKIRAFDPWPGTVGHLDKQNVKLSGLLALQQQTEGRPGEILSLDENGMRIACGQGALTVSHIQFPGSRRMPVLDAARGRTLLGLSFD
ncbi:MAG: methionyl-tRNA formyltransferase [Oceanococcus sp.]